MPNFLFSLNSGLKKLLPDSVIDSITVTWKTYGNFVVFSAVPFLNARSYDFSIYSFETVAGTNEGVFTTACSIYKHKDFFTALTDNENVKYWLNQYMADGIVVLNFTAKKL